jgi:hypothetical protein
MVIAGFSGGSNACTGGGTGGDIVGDGGRGSIIEAGASGASGK